MEPLILKRPPDDSLNRLGKGISPRRENQLQELLVQDQTGKLWLLNTVGNIDPARSPRARFAYLLGKPWVNITEILLLTDEIADKLKTIGLKEASSHCFLSRVADDYKIDELPLKTLDEAVAGELVFSLWIRRRDAHNENRSYTFDGIPVFYDFDVAFLAENEGRKASDFFGRNELGYAGMWRVRELPKNCKKITTEYARQIGRCSSIHLIHSTERFVNSCRNIALHIRKDNRHIEQIGKNAEMARSELEKVVPFLCESKENLLEEIEIMLKIIIQG